jgi:endonuclease VIII-like 1
LARVFRIIYLLHNQKELMPELAELKLTAQYINEASVGLKFDSIEKNPVHKGAEVQTPFDKFTISAKSRGKELVVYIKDYNSNSVVPMRMTMGMAGHFRQTNTGQENKHAHLKFHSTDGTTLSFVDVRRFGKWKIGYEWSDNRGPDPTTEYEEFVRNIEENLHKKAFDKPIMEVLMNQQYFNGIGNYLRAEILFRIGDINPFMPARDAIKQNPEILKYCKALPLYAFALGGGKIKDWKNPFNENADRSNFFLCYSQNVMSNVIDKGGRRFWYDPKWDENNPYK